MWNYATIPTRCPYTFREIDPAATESPYVADPDEAQLPPGWQNSGVITFAMAGARTSGKSIYIAVVVKLLERLTIEYGGTFDPADDFTRASYAEHYEAPLFGTGPEERRRVLRPTVPMENAEAHQRRPLIFRLGRPRRRHGESQNIFVVFRDVAGEDLEAQDFNERLPHLDFFQHADSVIYLYDPLGVPEIRTLLDGSVPLTSVSAAEPVTVLKNVVRALGPHRPTFALTLAKFDIMQEIQHLTVYGGTAAGRSEEVNWHAVMNNLGAAFRRAGSSYDREYSVSDTNLLHEEIRAMLMSLGAREMFNVLEQPLFGEGPHHYRCYAVSSLGASPSGENISNSGLAPFRCLDPLRAEFNRFGLF